jgi:tetratricopeptide (TPR) repeat protein
MPGVDIEDAYVALVQALEDHGPLSEDELVRALEAAGLDDDEIDAVLYDPPDVVQCLREHRWVSLPSLMARRVLTHRVTAEEAALDVLRLGADLVAVAPLLDVSVGFADGTDAWISDADDDADLLGRRDRAAMRAMGDDELLVMPEGYLASLGLAPSGLVAVAFSREGPVLRAVAPAALASVDGLVARIAPLLSDDPCDVDELVWTLCADDESVLTEALPPLTEVLDGAGFSRHRRQLAAPGVDIPAWYRDRRAAGIASRHRLRPTEAEAVLVLAEHHDLLAELFHHATALPEELDDTIPGELAREDEVEDLAPYRSMVQDAAAALSSPDVAAALLGECAGIGRDGAPALGMLAESLEEHAPRSARASFRWLRAKAYERTGDVLHAEDDLRAALAMDADHPLVLEDLGRFASDRGDADHALRYLQRAGVPADDHLVRTLVAHQPRAPRAVGRNEPCWCGSGRKRKQCHRDGGAPLRLEDRTAWLVTKTAAYLQDGPHRSLLMHLAVERSRHLPDGELLSALGDPLVHDCALVEGGVYAEFLRERGPLLPDDERGLVEQWALVERSLYDVEEVRAGDSIVLRDVRTGDRHEVTEHTASRTLRPGDLICTRVVPAGPQRQLVGGVEPISLGQRDELIALLDAHPDPLDVVAFLSRRFAPPVLQNTEGEDLVQCTVTLRVPDPAALAAELDDRFDVREDDGRRWVEEVVTMGVPRVRSTIEPRDDEVIVEANSHARADRTVAMLLELSPGAEVVDDVREPMAHLLAEARRSGPTPGRAASLSLPDDPAVLEAVGDMVRRMEEAWVDETIPALGGVTPRAAAADPTRRPDLLRLLDSFPPALSPTEMDPDRLRRLLDL